MLVLYDGTCGFCDAWVQWLLARDASQRLTFAPLQGSAAAAARSRHPSVPADTTTVVLVEQGPDGAEVVHLRSAAFFRICAVLPMPWRALSWLAAVPRPVADLGYACFARHRYRVFGRVDGCRVPKPEERARFLA